MIGEEDVLAVLDGLTAAAIPLWLDGGWGVDALVGARTRAHEDLDVVIARADCTRALEARVLEALAPLGFRHAPEVEPGLPARLVLRDREGRQVDVHPVVFDAAGDGRQELGDGTWSLYPAEGLRGSGRIGGRAVRCTTAELQLAHHLGYEPTEIDRHDVALLERHYGVVPPPPYDRRRD